MEAIASNTYSFLQFISPKVQQLELQLTNVVYLDTISVYCTIENAWRLIDWIDLNIGLSGVENEELGTKMSILALL